MKLLLSSSMFGTPAELFEYAMNWLHSRNVTRGEKHFPLQHAAILVTSELEREVR
jgi:hypothetical protein